MSSFYADVERDTQCGGSRTQSSACREERAAIMTCHVSDAFRVGAAVLTAGRKYGHNAIFFINEHARSVSR